MKTFITLSGLTCTACAHLLLLPISSLDFPSSLLSSALAHPSLKTSIILDHDYHLLHVNIISSFYGKSPASPARDDYDLFRPSPLSTGLVKSHPLLAPAATGAIPSSGRIRATEEDLARH